MADPTPVTELATSELIEPPHLVPVPGLPPDPEHTGLTRNRVTRLLSATAHLHGDYADHVRSVLLSPTQLAWAPCWGMDAARLAKNAQWAHERRQARDVQLAQITGAGVALVIMTITGAGTVGMAALPAVLATLVVAVAMWATACCLVYQHYKLTHEIAQDVLYTDREPEIADSSVLDELSRLSPPDSANVVVFAGDSPFVDMGTSWAHWLFKVDTSRGREDDNGNTSTPTPFTASELSRHVRAVVDRKLPDTRCANQLYVNGAVAPHVPGLMYRSRSEFLRPSSVVSQDLVDRFTDQPTEGARSYLCCQRVIWGGQVVVSFLMHFHLIDDLLFVEASVWALSPLDAQYYDGLALSLNFRDDRAAVVRRALAATTGQMVRSIFRTMVEPVLDRRHQARLLESVELQSQRGFPVRYGSEESLRSAAADPGELKYFSTTDLAINIRRIAGVMFDAIDEFLEAHGIATDDLSEQFKVIVNQNSMKFENSAVNFGSDGSATVTNEASGNRNSGQSSPTSAAEGD